MNLYATIGKIVAAVVAIAGIAFLVYKYMDAIKAWMAKLCPCCELEEDFEPEIEIEVVEEAPVEEFMAEEAPATEEAPAEEAPVADEADFAE